MLSLDVDPNLPPVGHREIGDERPYDLREVTWREWCAAGRLVCRGCRELVVFRRGRWRVAHFAHRAATTCRHARATDAERMAAVAALYAWLRSKCGRDGGPFAASTLTVEHWPTQPTTRSPIDVHVAGAAASFGYVLLDRMLRIGDRDAWSAVVRAGTALWHVSLGRRVRLWRDGRELVDDELPEANQIVDVELSPQARWAVRPSDHALPSHVTPADAALRMCNPSPTGHVGGGGCLHFLIRASNPARPTAEDWDVLTLRLPRSSAGRHERAVVRRTSLAGTLIDPRDGGFVHPGEHELLKRWRREVSEERASLVERQEENQRAIAAAMARRAAAVRPMTGAIRAQTRDLETPDEPAYDGRPKLATCLDCGKLTRDWWCYYGGNGTCRCNACGGQRR